MLRRGTTRSSLHYYLIWYLLSQEEMKKDETSYKSGMRRKYNAEELSENEFRKRYRLSKDAFNFLCEQLREKTDLKRSERVSLELKVLCTLSFYATGSFQHIVGVSHNLAQSTASNYINEVTTAILQLRETFIKFPSTKAERDIVKQKFYEKYGMPGVVGCIDGCHFHICSPKKDVEHLYYCRKHFYSLNVQMVCDSDGRILNINPKYGGATHDAFIWQNSILNETIQEMHRNHEIVWLLGDSGYPQRPWLMTPIRHVADGSPEAHYNTIHLMTRVVIENVFGQLKNRWRCLCKDRTLHYKPEKCARIIVACSILHNIAIMHNVPDPDDSHTILEPFNSVRSELIETVEEDEIVEGRSLRAQLVQQLYNHHR